MEDSKSQLVKEVIQKAVEKQIPLLAMMEKIQPLLEKLEIPFVATFGTALGAVRHGGFIPYDDDLDFCISRESAAKMMKYFCGSEKSKEFENWTMYEFIRDFFKIRTDTGLEIDFFIYEYDCSPPESWCFPPVYMAFHHLSLPLPREYERHLRGYYGDSYMTTLRVWNHYWNSQFKSGFNPNACILTMQELKDICAEINYPKMLLK